MEIVGTIKIFDKNNNLIHVLVGEREAMTKAHNAIDKAVVELSDYHTEFIAVEPEIDAIAIAKRILSKINADIRNKE